MMSIKRKIRRMREQLKELTRGSNGIFAIYVPLFIIFLVVVIMVTTRAEAQNVKTYIPPQAFEYRDGLYDEIQAMLPELPDYNIMGALIEHESCISLKHSRCWSATSVYSTKREHSVGFFQIAKAYRPDGTVRMDTLRDLKRIYTTSLKEATWTNLHQRPDLQMKAGMGLQLTNWNSLRAVKDPNDRQMFLPMAHNSGVGTVNKQRRACSLATNCNPDKYFDNVENHCTRSKIPRPEWGGRSVCDVSRDHGRDVLKTRLPKYQQQYFNDEYFKTKGKN